METSPPDVERKVWDGLVRGDSQSVSVVYQRHAKAVYRFAYSLTASADAAEEITQDVFLFLLQEWQRYDAGRGTLEAWLLGITRQLARRNWRQRSKVNAHQQVELMTEEPARPAGVLEDLLTREQQDLFHQAVALLPTAYRETLVLYALEGYSYEQTALAVGCAVGTVRSRIARAKTMLIAQLHPGGGRTQGMDGNGVAEGEAANIVERKGVSSAERSITE